VSRTKVLYVAGYGRSGSTLLDRLLGQVPGVMSVGEAAYVWEMGLHENRLCGCGEPFRECPHWAEVGRRAFGGWDRVDTGEVLSLRRSVDRNRYIPFMVRRGLWRSYDRRLERYASMMGRVLVAIGELTGARVLVDSSKFPSSGFVLGTLGEIIDLRVVHLVRDSRGVAYSWAKRVPRPDVVGRTVHMRRYSAPRVGMRWFTRNLAAERLASIGVPVLRMRYEDLVREPRKHVEAALELAGEPRSDDDLAFIGDGGADLGPAHTVHGNPMRIQTGFVPIRVDEEWRTRAPQAQRATVRTLTWPLLRRYGYGP
jgi:hypothetical protein